MSEHTAIQRLIREQMGQEAAEIRHMDFGHNSRTFQVRLADDRQVIVRTNENASTFASTERNLMTLGNLGLPVPNLLAADTPLTIFPFAYMILESIPGRDLRYELGSMTRDQMTRLAAQLVDYQRAVATLPLGAGYGYVGIGEKGPGESWWEFVAQNLDQYPADTERMRFWQLRASDAIKVHQDYLSAVPPTCFLDDITVKNVIVQNGELQGLVDFDCVCYGDPLWWIGLTASGVVSDVGTDALFYTDELCRLYGLTEAQRGIVPLYCAMHAIGFVSRWDGKDGPDWLVRMSRCIDVWIESSSMS